ncbi:hypothetical protein [Ferrimicrobium sp.]|uniref:hypothetical protein n=1 Tax=Ferrimicrobium sp. TaxID=2926050 RepID=UPI00263A0FD7|nr:hypothetical protein [Ferrimicrobium sp.]
MTMDVANAEEHMARVGPADRDAALPSVRHRFNTASASSSAALPPHLAHPGGSIGVDPG